MSESSHVSGETVTVVIATVDRPELLRQAVRAALAQDYAGPVDVVVVFDRVPPQPLPDIEVPAGRTLTTLANQRTPGLAGARNTGILAAQGTLVGFCDDDDAWHPSKLRLQMDAWQQDPGAVAVATGVRITADGAVTDRNPPPTVGFTDFLRSRISEVHPSSLLYRTSDLTGRVGLVDEELPASYGEDYDLLLRATRFGHVRSVPRPLVTVRWGGHSMFAGHWEILAAGLTYLLQKFPEFASTPAGTARIAGQVAFAHAALGQRRTSRRWARSALRRNPLQLRAHAAVLVASGAVSAEALLAFTQKRGRGL
ncbi:glycosyltransferase family 2 protein [Arthrobacter gengyunqii]|uniref:Glycosyltransferase family 2 protein n=1 Tax=Arthrobacter gengyunqii TaxID=2886940 RepID=A0A9X1S6Y6_9MICC|nr:glycosyltransferase family A protein [Arthrobacter gengyunqii]MCC3269651.1 glycosyltransferase family 2 protein [Arthrobacter gengyunqii]UOY97111.1 glycosyltransferase family 2 protein [Arthrobacter gengyunqii]